MDRLTLTQAARALGVPQHRLIHLCEKRVVIPDLEDARGRGSSRGFSPRNLFEFAIALELRRLELPVEVVRAVLQAVRAFEEATRRQLPEFALPGSLTGEGSLDVSVLVVDGTTLYFAVTAKGGPRSVIGGVELTKRPKRGGARSSPPRKLSETEVGRVIESAKILTEINLTRIARDLQWPLG